MGSAERIKVPNLTHVVECIQSDSCDDSHIVSHSLGDNLDVLDDSGLRQLNDKAPVEFGTGLEKKTMLEELLLLSLQKM